MSSIRAILVDPKAKTIQAIVLDSEEYFTQIRDLIEASTLDVVRADNFFGGHGGTTIYVDDEGLLIDPEFQAFSLVGQKVLAGKFVILREIFVEPVNEDDDGWRRVDVDFSLEAVRERVIFCNARYAAAALELGVQEAAAYFVARGMKVERAGNGLIVTPEAGCAGPAKR